MGKFSEKVTSIKSHSVIEEVRSGLIEDPAVKSESNDRPFQNRLKNIISDLEQIKDGWARPNTIAPNKIIRKRLEQILCTLKLDEKNIPEVQIDNDGAVTLFWYLNERDLYSIDILVGGLTICNYTKLCKGPSVSKTIRPRNDEDLRKHFKAFVGYQRDGCMHCQSICIFHIQDLFLKALQNRNQP